MLAQLLLVTLLASAAFAAPAPTPLPESCKYNNFVIQNRDLTQLATTDTVELQSAYGTTLNWDSVDADSCWAIAHTSGYYVAVTEHQYLGPRKVAPTFRCHFKTVPTSPKFTGFSSLMTKDMYGAVALRLKLGLGHYTIPGYNVQVDKAVAGITENQFKEKYEHCDIVSEVDGSVECKVFNKDMSENKQVILSFRCI